MENKDKKEKFISVPELAKMLGVSRIAVFNRIRKGQISAQKVGRIYAISTDEATSIMNGQKSNILTDEKKNEIEEAVEKVVNEYGETLKLLGKE